jgi:predicted acyl esterase
VPQEQEVHEELRADFRTAVLTQDVVLAVSVGVHLVVSIDSRDTDSAVRSFDAAPDGSKTLVASGWLKGSRPTWG